MASESTKEAQPGVSLQCQDDATAEKEDETHEMPRIECRNPVECIHGNQGGAQDEKDRQVAMP
jgi:hypothetical protein